MSTRSSDSSLNLSKSLPDFAIDDELTEVIVCGEDMFEDMFSELTDILEALAHFLEVFGVVVLVSAAAGFCMHTYLLT